MSRENTNISWNFLVVDNCTFHTIESVNARMRRFEVTTAKASMEASVLMHFAVMEGFHAPLIGLQAKIMGRLLAIVKARTKIPIPHMTA